MRLLVAGCGDLGTELALRAVDAGHEVFGLRRRAALLPSSITPIAGDLTDPQLRVPGGLDAVAITTAADGRDVSAYRRGYVDGPANLADALERAGQVPPRIVFTSSSAVYGTDDGSWVDEDTPTRPASPTAAVLVEAEQAFWQRWPYGVVLRLAGIYGPGRTRLLDSVSRGEAAIGERDIHTNRIHRDDAAAALLHLLSLAGPERCYVGVDDAPALRGEVLRFLAAELGASAPPVGERAPTRGSDKRLSNRRLTASGFALRHRTYREGYRAVLAGHGTRHR